MSREDRFMVGTVLFFFIATVVTGGVILVLISSPSPQSLQARNETVVAPSEPAASAAEADPQPAATDEPPPERISIVRVSGAVPVDDPFHPAWDEVTPTLVPLAPQVVAMPQLENGTIPEIDVRGMTDGRQIAWRLSWKDESPDMNVDTDVFCDAAAIQFPLVPNAAYTMGTMDMPVQIMQWKALWQKDIDEHFQDVQDLHPNYWADLYWFADGEYPFRFPDAFEDERSLDWFIAYRAGNSVAELYRTTPVQELVAVGFGTLTAQSDSATTARGQWQDGRWWLVFSRPLTTSDSEDYQFESGRSDLVAFAVWDGAAGNVGGRKQHSLWVMFEVEG